jgi:hypothetical protein
MIIVVDDTSNVSKSSQFITVPFRLLFTGLIINLDITGILLRADILEKLNTIELTVNNGLAELVEVMERLNSVAVVSCPRTTLNLHCSESPVVVHINSS